MEIQSSNTAERYYGLVGVFDDNLIMEANSM